jgi:cell division protein FtsB
MRIVILLLLALMAALQYRLWFGQHSVEQYFQRQQELKSHELTNVDLKKRNLMILADVEDLQSGLDSIEERARNELGLVKQNEVFFRLVAKQGKK